MNEALEQLKEEHAKEIKELKDKITMGTLTTQAQVIEDYERKIKEMQDHFPVLRKNIENEFKQKELHARLLGNIGNIAFSEGNFLDALNSYKKSQYLFKDVDDQEHIGIAKLQMAQTLIASTGTIVD